MQMQKLALLSMLLISTAYANQYNYNYQPIRPEPRGFTLGRRQHGDKVIVQRDEIQDGSLNYAFGYTHTYVGSDSYIITQIEIEDLVEDAKKHGGHVALVAGGPGHTYASLSFSILRRHEMNFRVTVYGKLSI